MNPIQMFLFYVNRIKGGDSAITRKKTIISYFILKMTLSAGVLLVAITELRWYGDSRDCMMILISAAFVLQIYASISIGHQANNHKGLLSVVTFIGLAIAQSVIESILGVNGVFNFHISNSGEIANGVSMAQEGMLVTILTAVAFGTIYYIITRLLMKYKLNLE